MQHYNNCKNIITAVDITGESQGAFRCFTLPPTPAQLGLFNSAGAPWAFCSLCMEASSWYTITLGQNAGIQALWWEEESSAASWYFLYVQDCARPFMIFNDSVFDCFDAWCAIGNIWQHDKWYLKLAGRWFVKGWPHPELHHLRLGILDCDVLICSWMGVLF